MARIWRWVLQTLGRRPERNMMVTYVGWDQGRDHSWYHTVSEVWEYRTKARRFEGCPGSVTAHVPRPAAIAKLKEPK